MPHTVTDVSFRILVCVGNASWVTWTFYATIPQVATGQNCLAAPSYPGLNNIFMKIIKWYCGVCYLLVVTTT